MLNEVTVLNIREYLAATETPGKAPKKGSAGSFSCPAAATKAPRHFVAEALTRPFPAPGAHCAGYPSASIFHAYNR